MGPKLLFLHGFASSPGSRKGGAFAERFGRRNIAVERLNLRLPSLEELRVSAGIRATRAAIGGERDRAVLIGSSLGGLTAARVAEADARVCALVLLAPAFGLADLWRRAYPADEWRAWEQTGWRAITDYSDGSPTRLHYEFIRDLDTIDGGAAADVRVPTLILHGRDDDTVPIEQSRRFAAGKPHVRLLELDDDHELLRTLPRILNAAEAFLAPYVGEASQSA